MIVVARLIVPFLAPLTIFFCCVLLGFIFLLARKQGLAKFFLALGLGLFIIFGYGLFTRQQLLELERQYPPFEVKNIAPEILHEVHSIVVLGSSHVSDPTLPETAQIGGSSLYRLIEGIRIQRQLPQARLVISGGVNQDPRPNAIVVSRVAELIGVAPDTMVIEDRPRDTFEEAEMLQPLLGDRPFILVTSAAHMVRAMQLFEKAGMHPIAAPTNFILKNNHQRSAESLLPSCGNLAISKRVIYEWLGTLWGYLKQIQLNFL